MIFWMKGKRLQATRQGYPFRLAENLIVWAPRSCTTMDEGDYYVEVTGDWRWFVTDDQHRKLKLDIRGIEIVEEYPEAVELYD